MRLTILFITFLIGAKLSLSQNVSLSLIKNNTVYIGIDNPISVFVDGLPSKYIIIKTDNGIISESSGNYILRITKPGKVSISVYKQINSKLVLLKDFFFRSVYLPVPTATLAGISDGKINVDLLKRQEYILARVYNSDINLPTPIDSFQLILIKKDIAGNKCIYQTFMNITGMFNQEIKDALQNVKQDDLLIIKDIYAKRQGIDIVVLNPIILVVTNKE